MQMSPVRVVILGSTGSIGRQALDVIATNPDDFLVTGLVAGSDGESLREQADRFDVATVGLGREAAIEIARDVEADVVLNAVMGAAGLEASVAALAGGKRLGLANKESLIAGGEICLATAARTGAAMVPVDSEHAALAQCLAGVDANTVESIVITASGGPFRGRTELGSVSVDEALAHPTWSMGQKITIDSATLMNKGLEVIEAHFLFGIDYEQIDVVVHPQSIVHGIVQMVDGSVLMQAAPTDMRIPIEAALRYPDREPSAYGRLSFAEVGSLTFEPVDRQTFPALDLAYEAGKKGKTFPAVLNAANEVAVAAFLKGSLRFPEITSVVAEVLGEHEPQEASELGSVLEVDGWARARAEELVTRRPTTSVRRTIPRTAAGATER